MYKLNDKIYINLKKGEEVKFFINVFINECAGDIILTNERLIIRPRIFLDFENERNYANSAFDVSLRDITSIEYPVYINYNNDSFEQQFTHNNPVVVIQKNDKFFLIKKESIPFMADHNKDMKNFYETLVSCIEHCS